MYKPHHKPKSKTSDISKQSPSPLHHTFLLGGARFTAQPLSALVNTLLRRGSKGHGASEFGRKNCLVSIFLFSGLHSLRKENKEIKFLIIIKNEHEEMMVAVNAIYAIA